MRILFVTLGESIHAARWIKQLEGQGWEIHVFPHSAYDGIHPELENLTFHTLVQRPSVSTIRQTGLHWPLRRGGRKTTATLQSLDYFKQPARLARVIRKLQPDLVHSLEMQRCSYLTLASRKQLNGHSLPPWIYSSWGSDIFFFGRRPDHQPKIREVLSACDYFIADCERDVQLAKDFGLRGEVFGVFPVTGGFDLKRLRQLGSGVRVSSRKVIALKGYQNEEWGGRALNALEALRLSAAHLREFEVVIFSATSEVKSAAERLAKETGIQISILPPSPSDEIAKLMGRARIAIGVGLTDGSPITLLEAMIMGAFPVQADTISTAEWIRDGENGLLVPAEQPEAIAAAIQRALTDDKLVERADELNTAIADQRLDQEKLRPRIIEMYKKAAGINCRRPRSAGPTVTWPKLLYVGDVPVEASYHGSALLHRLLSDYPHEDLTVIETAAQSDPARRLPEVKYIRYPIGKPRLLNTRFHPYATAWFSHAGTRLAPKISQSVNGFDFEGVLTVAHGFGWLAASRIASHRNVPLHLIVHDDWPRAVDIAPRFRNWLDAQFAGVYRQAQSRLSVSPAMTRAYLERYGKPAQIIYPTRAPDCPDFETPPEHLAHNGKPFTIAFAGTINSNGYIRALRVLQEALKAVGGKLLLFGPMRPDVLRQVGLDDPNTEVCGLLSAADLLLRLRAEADALFVPMSFDASDRDNMEMAFPSKLADCTATGVPLLIYGPPYCSAVAWARENEGVAEVVERESDLTKAVERLANDPPMRLALGKRALEVGRQYFSHDRVQQVFRQALSA